MKAMEFTKRFFNIEVPTISNFQEGGLEFDLDEVDDEEETPPISTIDTSQLDFGSAPYVAMTVESSESLFSQAEMNTILANSSKENRVKSRGESSSTTANFQPIKPNVSGKRKNTAAASNAIDLAILSELQSSQAPEKEDEVSLFLQSLVPQLKRLDPRTKAQAKCQIQQLLFEYEFGD